MSIVVASSFLTGAAVISALLTLSLIHISEPTRQAEISYAVFSWTIWYIRTCWACRVGSGCNSRTLGLGIYRPAASADIDGLDIDWSCVLAGACTFVSPAQGDTMTKKPPNDASIYFILVWFSLVISVFVIVTIPEEVRFTRLLPAVFWKLREVIYPLFFSPYLY